MKTAKKPSGALKQNYDKVILVAILIALLISAVLLVAKSQQGAAKIKTTREHLDAVNPKSVLPQDSTSLNALLEDLTSPYQLTVVGGRMMVGELRVSSIPDGLPIPFAAAECPFTQTPQPEVVGVEDRDTDGDGIPDMWEDLNSLNQYDISDGGLDNDADGFSNLDEYRAGTDPQDSTSTPPPPAKLRVVGVKVVPFKLRFLGISKIGDGERFQLNLRSLEKTYFAKMNEEIEGYEVVGFDKNGANGPELYLMKAEKKLTLVQDRIRSEEQRVAKMVYLVDGSVHTKNVGESVRLKGVDYKVVDIHNNRVVIRDEEAGRDIDVGMLSDAEKAALSGGSRTGVSQ